MPKNHVHLLFPYSAGEMMSAAEPFLDQQMHPTAIIAAYRHALDDILTICREKIG